jgi:hypothetical protein
MGKSEMEMPATSGKWKTLQVVSSYDRKGHSVAGMNLNAKCWVIVSGRPLHEFHEMNS